MTDSKVAAADIRCADFRSMVWPDRDGRTRILLTDPPYGIDRAWRRSWHGRNGRSTLRDGSIPEWDTAIIPPEELLSMVEWADMAVVCGGNFYPLPPSPCWFVWDKMQSGRGSDAELIWTNAPIKGVKVFRMSRIDAYFNKAPWAKKHIAEKPVQLFAWILSMLPAAGAIVCDPFMGTGSSAVAAIEAGAEYVGCDINPEYVEEAVRRVNAYGR